MNGSGVRALAIELAEQGRFEEAAGHFQNAIAIDPRDGLSHRLLSELEEGPALREHVDRMRVLEDDPTLGDAARAEIEFALGGALERLGEHDGAYEHYARANRLRRASFSYDASRERRLLEGMRNAFNPTVVQWCKGAGPDRAAIFIVGMPRSGTTLVESFLAAHPRVLALGEQTAFERAIGELNSPEHAPSDHTAFLASLRAQLRGVGEHYLSAIGASDDARIPVDKMPANFRFAAAIHLALPNAKIIHVRRDPIDTCFSCFATNFSDSQSFAFDVRELTEYYALYEQYMQYVRHVLPPSVLLEIQYEDVVRDPESAARAVLDHCGLAWDEQVLAYWHVQRRVTTASLIQVRRPIYRSSIGRARRFPRFCEAAYAVGAWGPATGGSSTNTAC